MVRPVDGNWVTWVGAAAFAAFAGAYLPSRAQARMSTSQTVEAGANTDY